MKVYVATHKAADAPLPPNYQYIQVNAANNQIFSSLHDALGAKNISAKNPYYCELTAAYWVWKNDHENEVVGLAHYRRFLTVNKFSSSPRAYLNSPRAEKLLEHYDFLATKLYHTNATQKEHLLTYVHEKDFDLLRETIQTMYPSYLSAFDEVFSGHESYLLNMFICKKQTWDAYNEWLFSVLEAMEPKVDMTGYSVQEQRLYGFLAERLFTVYVRYNHCRVKSFPTFLLGKSKWVIFMEKVQKMLGMRD